MEEKKGPNAGLILIVVGACLVIWFLFFRGDNNSEKAKEISFGEFMELVQKGEVMSPVVIQNTEVSGKLKNGTNFITYKEKQRQIGPELEKYKVGYKIKAESEGSFWSALLVNSLPIIIIVVIFIFLSKRISGGLNKTMDKQTQFGKAHIHKLSEQDKKTFADVAGIDEALEDVKEIVDFLRNPKKFNRLGAKMPKGVLLMGAPGTGKTLLARAIAGEADVPFFSISGSSFVEMFVGVAAARVRDLFEQAKKNSPCIIFIDELDALGRQRGAGLGGGHDEREQGLNQILVEMDGFAPNQGIVIVAATNRPDILDSALLRPGRFDRKVIVPRPDVIGREKILEVHTREKSLSLDVDLSKIAVKTRGMTGADLENLSNEAALSASRQGKDSIESADFEQAMERVRMGKPIRRTMPNEDKNIVACHEAGHAITLLCSKTMGLGMVSIVPRESGAMGVTMPADEEERYIMTKERALEEVRVSLAGRAAEEIVFGKDMVSSGASNDFDQANAIVNKMITEWGMSEEFGLLVIKDHEGQVFLGRSVAAENHLSPEMLDKAVSLRRTYLNSLYEEVKNELTVRRADLDKLMEALLARKTLSGGEVKELLEE